MSAAILIQTNTEKVYLIALEKPDEFARKLEERINEVRNIKPEIDIGPRIAS
jgi:hypothetical protein